MNEKKKQMPADDFGGYPGEGRKPDVDEGEDLRRTQPRDEPVDTSVWDDDKGDGGQAHIDPDWDIDLDRPPTKGERRIIELTLREVGAAGVEQLQEAAATLRELGERTEGMIKRVAKTMHDGIDEVFGALETTDEDGGNARARAAVKKACEQAHRTVDELEQDLRGEQ